MPPLRTAPEVEIASRAALRAWLASHHGQPSGVWLVTYKKAAGTRYLALADVVQECLCFGWVDSLPRKKDALRTMLYVSPRKPGSKWSAVNKRYVTELLSAGLVQPSGLRAIDRAKADGSWTALDDVDNGVIPPDLAAAFAAQPASRKNWTRFRGLYAGACWRSW